MSRLFASSACFGDTVSKPLLYSIVMFISYWLGLFIYNIKFGPNDVPFVLLGSLLVALYGALLGHAEELDEKLRRISHRPKTGQLREEEKERG
jgi:hypothetical protein